jgi:hypothetical protein
MRGGACTVIDLPVTGSAAAAASFQIVSCAMHYAFQSASFSIQEKGLRCSRHNCLSLEYYLTRNAAKMYLSHFLAFFVWGYVFRCFFSSHQLGLIKVGILAY